MHVYVHVPFCARRCSYCDFAIAVRRSVPDRAYVDAVQREWMSRVDDGIAPIGTLYFGGGTPSRLAPEALADLIGFITDSAPLRPGAEVTLEANPDDVTTAAARSWFAAGVNRVSLGVQSHDPAVLTWMHRTHHAEQVAPAVSVLRAAGITNVSLDLIFAVPPDLGRNWQRDVELTLALEPSHVSLYGLTIEPGTPLAKWSSRGEAVTVTDDSYAREYLEVHRALVAHGFEHYEVSNAGRPGFHSRHNGVYWTGADYVGIGPSAHSLRSGIRSWNVREWAAYRATVMRGESAIAGSEVLDERARHLEATYLGLRTARGLDRANVPESSVRRWVSEGWAAVTRERVVLTVEGWLRLDALVAGMGDS